MNDMNRGRSKIEIKRATPEERAELIEKNEAEEAEAVAIEEAASRSLSRGAIREEDPRTRAARRAAEIRNHGSLEEDGEDEFFIDKKTIPPGWDYEWKRRTVWNEENASYQVQLQLKGWEPVPASRHPEYMPAGGNYSVIERKGMVLMERPTEIGDAARQQELRKARQQVRTKEEQLNSAPAGTFDRSNKDSSMIKVGRSYEPIPIPEN